MGRQSGQQNNSSDSLLETTCDTSSDDGAFKVVAAMGKQSEFVNWGVTPSTIPASPSSAETHAFGLFKVWKKHRAEREAVEKGLLQRPSDDFVAFDQQCLESWRNASDLVKDAFYHEAFSLRDGGGGGGAVGTDLTIPSPIGIQSTPESPGVPLGGCRFDGAPVSSQRTGKQSGSKSLLGKMAVGVVTGGFDAGYFFECEVEDGEGGEPMSKQSGQKTAKKRKRLKGVLFSPVLTSQRMTADGKPTLTLPSYCFPGATTYAGAIQRIEFRKDGVNGGMGNTSIGKQSDGVPNAEWREAAEAARGGSRKASDKKQKQSLVQDLLDDTALPDDFPHGGALAADVAGAEDRDGRLIAHTDYNMPGDDQTRAEKVGWPKGKPWGKEGKGKQSEVTNRGVTDGGVTSGGVTTTHLTPELNESDVFDDYDGAIAEAVTEAAGGDPATGTARNGQPPALPSALLTGHTGLQTHVGAPYVKRGRGRPKGAKRLERERVAALVAAGGGGNHLLGGSGVTVGSPKPIASVPPEQQAPPTERAPKTPKASPPPVSKSLDPPKRGPGRPRKTPASDGRLNAHTDMPNVKRHKAGKKNTIVGSLEDENPMSVSRY